MARGQLATRASGTVEHLPGLSHPGSGRISYVDRYPLHYIPNNRGWLGPNGVKRLEKLNHLVWLESRSNEIVAGNAT